MSKFASRLKDLRKKSRLTQQELADKVGTNRVNITKWETGRTEPSLEKLVLLSEMLGVTTDYLLKGSYVMISKPNKREVGNRLRVVKDELGLSFSEFGQLLHLKKSTINAYVRGDNLAPLIVLEKVSELSGRSLDWFLRG